VPSVGTPNLGVAEFEGWTFVKKDWWVETAGNQGRGDFTNASGIIAVADPDEWDDFPSFGDSPSSGCDLSKGLTACYDAKLKTPQIPLGGAGVNQANVFFHSSWQAEGHQKASLTAHYDNGTDVELFLWDSRENIDDGMGGSMPNPNFKDNAFNESVNINLQNPAGASAVELEFRLFDAGNNWWWAFDNLQVFTGAAPAVDGALRAVIDRDTGSVKIVNNTGETVSLRGYSLRSTAGTFDEENASFLSQTDSDWLQATKFGDLANDLSEIHLTSDDLPNQAEINFGNVWQKYYRDEGDIRFEYLVEGNDEPIPATLEFIGNGDESFDFLDLNYNGSVEIGDWLAFKAGFGVSLEGKPEAVRHNLGDLDDDELHTALDFLDFQRRYDAANGAGAFQLAVAGVPEPSSLTLVGLVAALGLVVSGRRRATRLAPLGAIAVAMIAIFSINNHAHAQLKLFTEDFDSLTLGPNVEESNAGTEVWTNVPPTGWTIDNSGIPGIGNPDTDGMHEWAGWAFADKDWWVQTAGDQDRGLFSRGKGTVMIADPDEWDDADGQAREPIATAPTPDDFFDTFATTKIINIPAGIPAGRIKLAFDSSWRPEGMDDLDRTNNQTATIKVQYESGPKVEVLRWDSDPESEDFHDDAPNERVSGIDLLYNGTATTMKLEFGLGQAWNDWWWAVDNLSVEVPAEPSLIKIDTNTGRGFLVGGDVISTTLNSIDIQSPGGHLSGSTASGLSSAGGMETSDGPDDGTTAGDSPGERWEMLTASDTRIFEAFLFGDSAFDDSRIVDLGVIFDPTTAIGERDLVFSYTTDVGDVVTGGVEYFTAAGVLGDYSGDGKVDAADYTLWRDHLGSNFPLPNQGAAPGQITTQDYDVWKAHFGETINAMGGGVGAAASVPEPSTLGLIFFAAAAATLSSRRQRLGIVLFSTILASIAFSGAARAVTLDRDYRFGNNDPGAAPNGFVGVTFDSAGEMGMHQLTDLAAFNSAGQNARYVNITDRPDGVSGLGIRFNVFGGEGQYLKTGFGEALNFPEQSPASTFSPGGTIDYSYVSDRGFQLWAKPTALPTAGGRFDIVMDSNQHGVSIDSAGKFVMRYAYNDYVSEKSAVANSWYHLSVVRPFGPNNGSILYVNGEAVAAAKGRYNIETLLLDDQGQQTNQGEHDTSPLVVGANTGIGSSTPDDPRPPTPTAGTQNFFRGIVDDLEMFVMGLNHTRDFGEYEFQSDNDYAAHFKPTNPVDLTGEGSISFADAQVFASNWLFENLLEWTDVDDNDQSLLVGDLVSRSKGDFNFDGRVDLADWGMLNSASPGVGAMAMTLIQGGVVPEPSAGVLALSAGVMAFVRRRRRSAQGTTRQIDLVPRVVYQPAQSVVVHDTSVC
jgi:hypothetical protein